MECIVCGKSSPAGLHIFNCLICFPCEKRLLRCAQEEADGRRLRRGNDLHAQRQI